MVLDVAFWMMLCALSVVWIWAVIGRMRARVALSVSILVLGLYLAVSTSLLSDSFDEYLRLLLLSEGLLIALVGSCWGLAWLIACATGGGSPLDILDERYGLIAQKYRDDRASKGPVRALIDFDGVQRRADRVLGWTGLPAKGRLIVWVGLVGALFAIVAMVFW